MGEERELLAPILDVVPANRAIAKGRHHALPVAADIDGPRRPRSNHLPALRAAAVVKANIELRTDRKVRTIGSDGHAA